MEVLEGAFCLILFIVTPSIKLASFACLILGMGSCLDGFRAANADLKLELMRNKTPFSDTGWTNWTFQCGLGAPPTGPNSYSRYRGYWLDLPYKPVKEALAQELAPQGFTISDKGGLDSFRAYRRSGKVSTVVNVTHEESDRVLVRVTERKPPPFTDEVKFWFQTHPARWMGP